MSDFRKQQICFETRNYYCLTSEHDKSVLNKKLLSFDFRTQQICFETRNYYCLTSEHSKSVLNTKLLSFDFRTQQICFETRNYLNSLYFSLEWVQNTTKQGLKTKHSLIPTRNAVFPWLFVSFFFFHIEKIAHKLRMTIVLQRCAGVCTAQLHVKKTNRPTTPSGIFSRVLCISVRMRDSLLDSLSLFAKCLLYMHLLLVFMSDTEKKLFII